MFYRDLKFPDTPAQKVAPPQSLESLHDIRILPALSVCEFPRPLRLFKRGVDILSGLLALPLIASVALVLWMLNPFFNPGPVFFRQLRMGQGGRPIVMWKFRTMRPGDSSIRTVGSRVEEGRITALGHFLRRTRIDELPNFINVLKGEMSLVGPRPEAWEHAVAYIGTLPGYHLRFSVRPGITGLAQVRIGYAEDADTALAKSRYDRIYIRRASIGMELHVIFRTIAVMLTGFGAR